MDDHARPGDADPDDDHDAGDASSVRDAVDAVDVVVVTFDTAETTPALLRRLVDEDTGGRCRVLVHDNASGDGTAAAIRALVPEALVESGDVNVGFARGVNRVLARSDAPWVLLLNPDAVPEPGALDAMIDAARAHPGAVVTPRLVRPDGTPEHHTHPFPSLVVAALTALGAGRWWTGAADRHLLAPGWAEDRGRYVDWAVGAALLVPRDVLDAVGGLDERFFLYAEDLEWCWRAADRGHRVWFEPSAAVTHVGGASARQHYDSRRRTHTHLGNTYRVLADRWPRWRVVAYRILQTLGTGRVWLLAILRRRPAEARRWRHHLEAHLGRGTEADR